MARRRVSSIDLVERARNVVLRMTGKGRRAWKIDSAIEPRQAADLGRQRKAIMERNQIIVFIQKLIRAVERRIPEFLADEADRESNEGNSALCIIDDAGAVHGRMFGTDKIRMRRVFHIAWTKASQVWITGLKTGEYEKLVFTGKIDEDKYGIMRPDFIGWEGGQPIALDAHTSLAIGFSGFRGASDLKIVQQAVADVLAAR